MSNQELELTFEKGLVEAEEESTLGSGMVGELKNWVPEASGSLRVRVGWSNTGTGGDAPGTRRTVGMGYSALSTSRFVAAVRTVVDTEVGIFALDRDDLTGNWQQHDTITLADGAGKHVDFDTGLGNCFYTSPAFDHIRAWDGTGSGAEIAGSPAGSRSVCFHASHIWGAEGTDLIYSALGDGETWPGGDIQVGRDDGEPIEALVEVGDDLLIGKENTLWDLSGSGVNTFELHKLPGPCGVAPGRTLVNTPYGVVIIGREVVWLWDQGGPPKPISKAIELNYGMTGRYMSGTYIDGVCYIVDEGQNDYWAFSPETGNWWMESLDGSANAPTNVYSLSDTLLMGTDASTIASIAMYRRHPAQPGTRVKDFDDLSETFTVRTPELRLAGRNRRSTVMQLNLSLRQREGESFESGLEVTHIIDGARQPARPIAPQVSGTHRARISFGGSGFAHAFEITQTAPAGSTATFDIEGGTVEFQPSGLR